MSVIWVVVLSLAGEPSQGAPLPAAQSAAPAAQNEAAITHRTGYELRDAVRAALRRWAKPTDARADQAAREFLGLFEELQKDRQLAVSTRKELLFTVRGRLLKLSEQISRRIAKAERADKGGPATIDAPQGRDGNLAQMFGGRGMGMQPGFGGGMGGPGFGGMGQQGFGGGFGQQGFGGGNPFQVQDNGQELVDLIQQVIAPTTWDVNGGPGSIRYWRSQHALVISATDEVHEQIGGMLDQLERANH